MQYLMHIHRQTCQFCTTEERWSHIYSCDDTPDAKYPKLIPTSSIPDMAPMTILELPIKRIEICSQCAPRRQSTRSASTYEEWRNTLRKKQEAIREEVRIAARASTRAPKPTLEDVL